MFQQSTLNINNVYNNNNNNTATDLNNKQPTIPHAVDYNWQQKIQKNRELLLMMHKLQEVEQSVWGKFFQFERSSIFVNFQSRFTFKNIFKLRLDDVLYLAMLVVICIVFALLPSQNTTSTVVGSLLVTAYRYMLAFLILGTMLWLASGNCFRHWVFVLLGGVFPLLVLLVYQGIIPFWEVDTSTSIFVYLHILSLWVVMIALYVVYPIKQFVRNRIGSLYSYLFALSTLTLFLIWPAYSLIEQLATNSTVTFSFLAQNKALIIAFLVIVIFTFHLFTHHTFFEGDIKQTRRLLLIDFSKTELQQALQQVLLEQPAPQNTHSTQKQKTFSFLHRNFVAYTRTMSFLVFAFTMAVQIYVFLYLTDNLTQIFRAVGVMVFCVGFCVYGCIVNIIPISRQATLYVFSVLALVPMAFSPFYCDVCSNSTFTYYQYIFLATALPYTTIFWCIVRSLSKYRPFLRTNLLVIMYIFAHVPLTLFMINNLQMLTTDTSTMTIINIVTLGIVGGVVVVGFVWFLVWLCMSIKDLPQDNQESQKIIDYNYWEQGNPMYVPYKKKQSFSLSWLSSMDIRNLAQLLNCIAFISCQLITMYIFNQLLTTYSGSNFTFIFDTTRYIIYSQFFITFAYYSYAQSYIIFGSGSGWNYFVLAVLAIVGVVFVAVSYAIGEIWGYVFRVGGGCALGIFGVGIGLHIIKINNKDIMNFLSGVITSLIWIFLVIPYAIALPIISIYIQSSQYGVFIYTCILATALLIILMVSAISIVFNTLMNKFQQDKKAKFMTEDVQTYLRQEGVETEDQILHVLFESFEHRDQKYVYFMRRGYPIRLFADSSDVETNYKTVVYNHQILNKKQSLSLSQQEQKSQDYCWLCLTCFCGVDQSQLQSKAAKIQSQQMFNQEQMQELMPEDLYKKLFVKSLKQATKKQKKYVDLSKLYSSKSIILKHLTQTNRHLGEQFAIVKTKKNKKLANQLWHLIFDFIANQDDYPPAKIIFNDFLIFCSIIDLPDVTRNTLNEIFLDFSSTIWKNNTAIDINDFSVIIQELANRRYQSNNTPNQQNKYQFLVEAVYPNLCGYAQFQDLVNQRRVKTKKNNGNGSRMEQRSSKPGLGQKIQSNVNLYAMTDEQHEISPFMTSFQRYQQINNKLGIKRQKLHQKHLQMQKNRLIQPVIEHQIVKKQKKPQKDPHYKSCKLKLYQKYQQCKNCCKKIEQQQAVIKRKNVKPWDYLAVQSIRILEHKQKQWKDQRKQKQYQFRLIINNMLIALFKLADLYTFVEITIMNPVTGWQSVRQFGILIVQYRVQLYISFGLVLVCGGLGIKGISYIFQDRLGLTETRLPAVFPHPMFFFTFIYKLLILSFFNVITMTLLSTFMCNWTTSTTNTYTMILDSTNQQLQCFSTEHNIYMIFSLVALILYYPLSAYTMPNFQFSQKRLDLKYKPSYLIIFFQVNFVLSAGKVLLSQLVSQGTTNSTIQIIFQSINIFCLALLCVMVVVLRPCLITWFNVVEFGVIWVGLVWNVMGLVLYLTGLWMMCVIVAGSVSVVSVVGAIVFVRRRFFGAVKVQDQAQLDDINQIQLAWKHRKQYNIDLVRYNAQEQRRRKSNLLHPQQQKQIYFQKQSITQNDQKQSNTIQGKKNRRNNGNGNGKGNADTRTHAGSNKNIPLAVQILGTED